MAVRQAFDYRMTEEIVRWRYEIALRQSATWWIAFTNPTAGPWKRLMGRTEDGKEGEVYRFPRDEDRPDVVAVNDKDEVVLVVEAKDTLERLMASEQVSKSTAVVRGLSEALSKLNSNPFWGKRSRYEIVGGLLWGRSHTQTAGDKTDLFSAYAKRLPGLRLVAFEIIQAADGTLTVHESRASGLGTRSNPLLVGLV